MNQKHKIDTFLIGNQLRDLREAKGLTQMEVVLSLGISYNHYAKIEEGMRGMSLKMLFMFMNFFNTDANTILGITREAL